MGMIINNKEVVRILLKVTNLFEKEKLEKLEVKYLVEQLLISINVFDEYDQKKALRKTLFETGEEK